jgi:hypothetical protein
MGQYLPEEIYSFESAIALVLYEPHKIVMRTAFVTSYALASEGYQRLGGTIPPLQKSKANPLEFTHSRGHLPGKYSPTVARASNERPGVPIVQSTCSPRPARGNSGNSQ